ncbi:hypothetical protein NLU13_8243 [Sarocladium strictum]|uniref:Zn(2)-C6 fungal-type domain-containing protein n=1 Tax=Sarocladium strictum TaxID=5046 RepID=A0AA39L509_SARSR|nr:hypothetical protein NLU13_8243 [Sarocladium strictum]
MHLDFAGTGPRSTYHVSHRCRCKPLSQIITDHRHSVASPPSTIRKDHEYNSCLPKGLPKSDMVYCGRPSSACHACRKVAGKCDRKRPCCSQCRRKGILCPGYQDLNAVLFRDQTTATIRRVSAKQSATSSSPSKPARSRQSLTNALENQHTSPLDSSDRPSSHVRAPSLMDCPPQPLPPGQLSPSLEEVATTFFWSCYAPNTSLSSVLIMAEDGVLDSLPPSVVIAPALAMMSQEMNQPSLLDRGRRYYSTAIQEISSSLQSSEVAKQDTTLLSVLLISLFDSIAPRLDESSRNWSTHVNGAVQLVRLRGHDQLSSRLGRAMLSDVSSNVYTSCAQRRVPVPDVISEMRNLLLEQHGEDPGIGLGRVAELMLNLAVRIRPAQGESLGPIDVLCKAYAISDQLQALFTDLGEHSSFIVQSHAEPGHDAAYNNISHEYQSPQAARHWNVLRLMKIFISKWIFNAANSLHHVWLSQQDASAGISSYLAISQAAALSAEAMTADILATVPFYRRQPSWQSITAGTARWLIWPLSTIAGSELSPASARIYAQSVLCELSQSRQGLEARDAPTQVLPLGNPSHLYNVS